MRFYFILTCIALSAAALGSFYFQASGFSGGRF